MMLTKTFPAAAALLLAGCMGLGGPPTPSELLTLTAAQTRPVAAARTAAAGEAVTVVQPTVPQALQTKRIPVYVSPTTVQYLTNAQWVDSPNELFRHVLSETIAGTTGRVVLDPRQYSHEPGTRLTGQLVMFGLDPARMEVVALYDAALGRGTSVVTNRFEARVPVADQSAAAVAPALNEAANRIAADVARWIGG